MYNRPAGKIEPVPAASRIHIDEPHAAASIAASLERHLERLPPDQPVILLCIGSDRSTGDSLGPLIGSQMESLPQEVFRVYGTLDSPVHATNLHEALQRIRGEYVSPYVIAVDACLGKLENVGCVNIGRGALRPGAGVKKNLPPVGDLHITGVVNVGGFMEFTVLQNTRLNMVMRIADVVCAALRQAAAARPERAAAKEAATAEAEIGGTQAI